jgi:hypothetical protein
MTFEKLFAIATRDTAHPRGDARSDANLCREAFATVRWMHGSSSEISALDRKARIA